MAKQDSTRVHRCAHCNKEFFGRKKKFCTPVCRDEHRKQSKRQHINGDRQSCSECGEWWPTWLFKSAQSNAKCDACARRRQYLRETGRKCVPALPDPVWRTSYIHRRFNSQLNLTGNERCYSCKRVHPSSLMAKALCPDCRKAYNASKQRRESKRDMRLRNARHRHGIHFADLDTYNAWRSRQAFERQQSRAAESNAKQALEWYIREGAADAWVKGWFLAKGVPWKNPRLTELERHHAKLAHNPVYARHYKVKQRIKTQLRKKLPGSRLCAYMRSAVKRGSASDVFQERFGYSVDELIDHLERQFTRGMSWERFDAGEIHIDHITPKSSFDLGNLEQVRACWCLSNLRPMWARENIKKGSAIQYLI